MIRFLSFAIFLILPSLSWAVQEVWHNSVDSIDYPSAVTACQSRDLSDSYVTYLYRSTQLNGSTATCAYDTYSKDGKLLSSGAVAFTVIRRYICDDGKRVDTPEQCVTCPAAGTSRGSGAYRITSTADLALGFCDSGCTVEFSGTYSNGSDGKLYAMGSMSYSGNTCTGGASVPPTGSPPPQDKPCETGNTVVIDGQTICMPAGETGGGTDGGTDGGDGDGAGGGTDGGDGDGTGGDGDGTGDGDGSGGDGTGGGGGTGGGDSETPEQKGQCVLEPDSPMCRKGTAPTKGKFEERSETSDQLKQQLADKFNQLSASLKSKFQMLSSGSGSLPCRPPITVLGQSFSMCFKDYESQLAVVGQILVFAATLIGVGIVLRR